MCLSYQFLTIYCSLLSLKSTPDSLNCRQKHKSGHHIARAQRPAFEYFFGLFFGIDCNCNEMWCFCIANCGWQWHIAGKCTGYKILLLYFRLSPPNRWIAHHDHQHKHQQLQRNGRFESVRGDQMGESERWSNVLTVPSWATGRTESHIFIRSHLNLDKHRHTPQSSCKPQQQQQQEMEMKKTTQPFLRKLNEEITVRQINKLIWNLHILFVCMC